MDKLFKHLGKLVLAGFITCVFSGFAYVGTTWESRLQARVNAVESKSELDGKQLSRIEQKLDDLIAEVRRMH